MFSKLLLIYLVIGTDVCTARPQLLGLLNLPFNILNRLTCSLIELLDMIDGVSYKIWMMGDVNQKAPENAAELNALFDGFLGKITDTSIISQIASKFPLKIGQENLIESFFGNFNRSKLIDNTGKNMPAIIEQAKIYNNNKQRLAPIVKKYRSALINAGSVLTKQTLSGIACYVKKYFEEISFYLLESLYPLRDILFSPYINMANALGADPQCDWKDVPDMPDDMCFRSLDVLFIKAISNLFKIKYLNFFSSSGDHVTDNQVNATDTVMTEKDIDVTENNIDETEKDIDSTEKDIDSTEKDIDSTEKDIDSTEKDIDSTEKDIDSTKAETDSTKKDIDVTENVINLTEDFIDETDNPIFIMESTKRRDTIHRSPLIKRKSSLIWKKQQQKNEKDKMDNPREWGYHDF